MRFGMQVDQERFEVARNKIIGMQRDRNGIGTLSEKTLHAVIKNYYAPDEDNQEIPIERLVADIYTGSEIIEIQTRNFDKLRAKLNCFLPNYPVTVVYPIPFQKWLIWIDQETGEVTKKRKSPSLGNVYVAFKEFYKIKAYLPDPNLRFKLLLINMEEYRLLNGWSQDKKKGSSRFDRIPTEFVEEIDINEIRDYMQFVPFDLEEHFTSEEFARATHIKKNLAQQVLNILYFLGIVIRVGKRKNSYLYQVPEEVELFDANKVEEDKEDQSGAEDEK